MNARRWALALAIAFGALFPTAAAQGVACAAGAAEPHAALVVNTGAGELQLCVELDANKVSGLHLIELAGAQHGLDYRFDGGAVCRLAGVGTDAGEPCFGDYPEFWGFWSGDGSGGWSWSTVGAGSATVGDGGMHGWAWGKGDDGGSHPAPSAVAFRTVCADMGASDGDGKARTKRPGHDASGKPRASRGSGGRTAASPSVGDARSQNDSAPTTRDDPVGKRRVRTRSSPRAAAAPSGAQTAAPAYEADRREVEAFQTSDERAPRSDAPLVVALLITVVLGAIAAVLLWRRAHGG